MGEHVKEAAAPRRYRVTFLSVIGELLITIAVILGLFAFGSCTGRHTR